MATIYAHSYILHAVIYIFAFTSTVFFISFRRDSTWTQAASLLSVGARPGRNHGLCVWRVKTAGGGGGWWWWWGGVGRIAALAPCILGLGVRAFVGTFPRLSRIASSPPTMTAAGGPGSRVVGKFHLECYSERKGRSCAELESALVTEGSRLYSV